MIKVFFFFLSFFLFPYLSNCSFNSILIPFVPFMVQYIQSTLFFICQEQIKTMSSMDQNEKIQIKKFFDKLPVTHIPITTPSSNEYRFCRRLPEEQPYCILKTIKNIKITKNQTERLRQLKLLPSDQNLVPVYSSGYNKDKSQAYILYQHFTNSESLQSIVEGKGKKQINEGILKSIFYQFIRGMVTLQTKKLNHMRLNPSSLLVKFGENNSEYPVARICDYGLAYEPNYANKFCLHPELVEGQANYEVVSYEKWFKYDLWAFGSVLYYVYEKKKPFYGKQKMIGQSQIFKKKHCLNPGAWLERYGGGLKKGLLQRVISICWGLKTQNLPEINSWKQLLDYYQQSDYIALPMQKVQIFDIYKGHLRIVFLFSKIFIILREELKYRTTGLIKIENNLEKMQKLSLYLFQLLNRIHCQAFAKNFRNRCSALCLKDRDNLKKIDQYLEAENLNIQNNSIIKQITYEFKVLLKNLPGKIIQFKLSEPVVNKDSSPKVRNILKFLQQLIKVLQEAFSTMNKDDKQEGDVLNIFYQSKVFNKLANEEFGFQIPSACLIQK